MSILEVLVILAAGTGAGAINAVVGSGTLITFPVLLAVGYSPVVANVSNCIGLVPGSFSGAIGYRNVLEGQRERALHYAAFGALGAVGGAVLLLTLPEAVFAAVVPAIIAIALVLIVLQPRLDRLIASRRQRQRGHRSPLSRLAVLASGVYGGYFGAAQGILLIAILGLSLPDSLQRVNALKNVIAFAVNGVAAIIFIAVADVAWAPVLLIAVGSTLGGFLGAAYGQRLPDPALRAVIVIVGSFAIWRLVLA